MTNDIFIDESKFRDNETIPADVLPKRYAIATNILCSVDTNDSIGFLVLNSEPLISNTFYPFYTTINNYYTFIEKKYQSLVTEFNTNIISNIEKDRISPTINKFSEHFNCGQISVENMQIDEYWLKYSKSSNVWTIYLFESFVISAIENKEGLISCLNSHNALLPLDEIILTQVIASGKYKGIPIATNIRELLKNPKVLSTLRSKNI